MSIIQKLWWFFKLEKRRYLVGIVALILVSVLNLIPPMVMGRVIDAITSGQLTQQDLLLSLFYLLLAAFGMYYLRYVWRMYILGTQVKRAVQEQNGQLIVVQMGDENPKYPVVTDGVIQVDVLESIGRSEEWLLDNLSKQGHDNVANIFIAEYDKGAVTVVTYE
ncbi:ABC transporter ATP-binding protein/permease [Streptococcus pneumoniae]|nr:ABC transporter ATP-binding protein/permease [Streptococcus pneumoniae]